MNQGDRTIDTLNPTMNKQNHPHIWLGIIFVELKQIYYLHGRRKEHKAAVLGL
jgi:hypothetical protein